MKTSLAFISAMVASSMSFAAPGGWHDRGGDRFRSVQGFNLGTVRIGFENRRVSSDTLDIVGNPRIQCNLTHIKLQAVNDSVRILALEVEYAHSRNGQSVDRIDLNDNDDFRRWGRGRGDVRPGDGRGGRGGWGDNRDDGRRMDRGIALNPGESTPLLDLDDVQDGFPNGRCVKSVRVIGIDTPDFGRGGGRGRGYGGRYNSPATVQVEGFLTRVGRPGGDHGGRPGDDGGRPGDGRGGWGDGDRGGRPGDGDGRGGHGGGRGTFEDFGLSGFLRRGVPFDAPAIGVGPQKGSFRGLRIQAKDDAVLVDEIVVEFMNNQRVTLARGLSLREGDETDVWFGGSRPEDSRASMIKSIFVRGQTPIIARSKGQLRVSGIR